MEANSLSVSIVSHGQGALARRLLEDLKQYCSDSIEVLLTENIPEADSAAGASDRIERVRNSSPRGFGANHNEAFRRSRGSRFCVLNPDVRLASDPFPALLKELESNTTGVVAPLIVNSSGDIEDSARRFPTPLGLLRKALGRAPALDYPLTQDTYSPDWIAGMFMLFRRDAFERVSGFDERYFLYYEDIDLCARLRLAGYDVRVVPRVRAVHDAQRRSHRDPMHLAWHVASILRFFNSPVYRRAIQRRESAPASGRNRV
jgi:GT2 family glycosyltransferase